MLKKPGSTDEWLSVDKTIIPGNLSEKSGKTRPKRLLGAVDFCRKQLFRLFFTDWTILKMAISSSKSLMEMKPAKQHRLYKSYKVDWKSEMKSVRKHLNLWRHCHKISSKFTNMIQKIDNTRVFEHPLILCEDAVDELFQPTQMTIGSRNECKDI